MPRRITMADVAREAGVSLMTVSRVVNGKPGISAATRTRIQQIINRMGYRPSDIARGLVTNRTGTLGLVVPDIANPFFSEVGRGAEDTAYARGYNVFLCNTGEDITRERAALFSLEEKRVDGVIVCSPRQDDHVLSNTLAHFPAAILVNHEPVSSAAGVLMIDDRHGGYIATRHLIQQGHTHIAHLAGPDTSHSARQRVKGYRDALAEAGIPFTPDYLVSCAPQADPGNRAVRRLLNSHPEITALFCYNDLVAVGALQAAGEMRRTIPGDLAVVGYDNIPLAALVSPQLTTCHVPRYELGREAMQLLLAHIIGEPIVSERTIQPALIVRQSAP